MTNHIIPLLILELDLPHFHTDWTECGGGALITLQTTYN